MAALASDRHGIDEGPSQWGGPSLRHRHPWFLVLPRDPTFDSSYGGLIPLALFQVKLG